MPGRFIWLSYLVAALVIVPAVFFSRYRRWPILWSFPPHDRYAATNLSFAVIQGVYTVWLFAGRPSAPASVGGGLGLGFWACGATMAVWGVAALGPNWRIGQDPFDRGVRFVVRGPYRFMRHPIYAGLVVAFIGQGFLTGFDARAWLLIVSAVVYLVVQGGAETRYWRGRRTASGDNRTD